MSRPVHGGARRTQGLASGNGSAGGGEAFDVDAENRHLDGGVDAGTQGWDARGSSSVGTCATPPLLQRRRRRRRRRRRQHHWRGRSRGLRCGERVRRSVVIIGGLETAMTRPDAFINMECGFLAICSFKQILNTKFVAKDHSNSKELSGAYKKRQ